MTAQPPQKNELRIVMTHHPLRGGWLADERQVERWGRTRAHLHLSGHMHEADSADMRGGTSGSFVRISAGASHDDQGRASIPLAHGYNFAAVLALPDGSLTLRVWPRRWSDKNIAFHADVDALPDGQLFVDHPLSLSSR